MSQDGNLGHLTVSNALSARGPNSARAWLPATL